MFERGKWPGLGREVAGKDFTPRWPDGPTSFVPWGAQQAEPQGDPVADQLAEISLWDAAYAAGRNETLAELARVNADADRLAQAIERLAPMPQAELADALAGHVRALLRRLIGEAPVDEQLLIQRCAELAALASQAATASLRAHPDDAELLANSGVAITLVADPSLLRGELRLHDGPGEMAAGPHTMLDNWDNAPC